MVDHHAARLGARVGVSAPGESGDDATLGGDDIGGASGISGRQLQAGADFGGEVGVRGGGEPVDRGRRQFKARPRSDHHDGDRRRLALDHILQHRLVIALRTKQGLGGLHGSPGPAAGLEAVGGGRVNLANRPLKLGAKLRVHFATNLRPGIGRGAGGDGEPRHAEQKQGGA